MHKILREQLVQSLYDIKNTKFIGNFSLFNVRILNKLEGLFDWLSD
mgnify:CR=1 FL=1